MAAIPIDERWRVDLTAILLIVGLVPMAIPRVPFKRENALYLLVVFPLVALILLTGGNFDVSAGLFRFVAAVGCFAVGLTALFSATEPAAAAMRALAATAAALGIVVLIAALALGPQGTVAFGLSILDLTVYVLALIALLAGIAAIQVGAGPRGALTLMPLGIGLGAVILLLLILRTDFGLKWVETPLWGGLLVTLVVAIVGMVGVDAARHPARPRPPVEPAGGAVRVDRLHRVRARRAADHGAVHGERDAAVLPAAGGQLRQAAPGADRRDAVLRGLHGGGRARRPAGDPARAVRGGERARPGLLEIDAADHPAAGAEDRDPRASSTASSACSRTRAWC